MGTGCIHWYLKGEGSHSPGRCVAVGPSSGCLSTHSLCDLGHVPSCSISFLQFPWPLHGGKALRLGPGSSFLSTTISLGDLLT